jgi:hypothetical protein
MLLSIVGHPYGDPVMIRDAQDGDWPAIYPFFSEIVAEGQPALVPAVRPTRA